MRTTVDLSSDLFRRAKASAARRGESLKSLVTRAIAAEIGQVAGTRDVPRRRVELPLFGDPAATPVHLSGRDLARALADADAARARQPRGRRR
jgi:hypothetical protein